MEIAKVTINNPDGLHLRPAAKIVRCAQKYRSKIVLCRGCRFADTCSITDVLSLAAGKGVEVAVIAEGPDEREAIRDIAGLFSDGGGI